MPAEIVAEVASRYELPGTAVFPETIGVDTAAGDAYMGSLAGGTPYRRASQAGRGGRGSLWLEGWR